MAVVNLTCVICTDLYKNSDNIISTSCGHVFHYNCLTEWRMRCTLCPTCRASNVTTFRLYLNFEEGSSEKDKHVAELKSKIDQHIKQSSLLQQQLDQSERDFLQLGEQFTKKDEEAKELHKKIEYLTLQNETRSSEIEMKTIEIHKLQEALNSTNPQASTIMLQEEIKILKEKNKHISHELNKEIENGMQLSVKNMKLENMLQHLKSMPPVSSIPTSLPTLSSSSARQKNDQTQAHSKRPERPNSSQSGSLRANRGCIQSVVIKNVKGTFADEDALKSYVFKLTDIMDLFYSGDDLQQVTVLERKQQDSMSLIAKFKDVQLKSQFLSRKDRLRNNADTKNVSLYEYVSDNTNSLFHYAKTLKPLGFKHIYCRNNVVCVRKADGSPVMRITKREDVDKLKNETADQSVGEEQPSSSSSANRDEEIERLFAQLRYL